MQSKTTLRTLRQTLGLTLFGSTLVGRLAGCNSSSTGEQNPGDAPDMSIPEPGVDLASPDQAVASRC